MKRTLILIFTMVSLIACDRKTNNKDMHTLTFSTEQAAWMTAISAFEAQGDLVRLETAINNGLSAGLTVCQIKEALSQLYAYTGFPRSLNALSTLQKVLTERNLPYEEGCEASPVASDYNALKQGTKVQTELTGHEFNYTFAPQTDYYLKSHLFGDIFARDNLTYADRELITVSALSAMTGVEPQLSAHIAGARNMGVTEEQLQNIVVALAGKVGSAEAGRLASLLQTDWDKGQPNTAYAQFFVGNSYLRPYTDGIANVTFEPACRNNWHIHHGAVQVLVCVSGRGLYQEWGKDAIELTPGKVIAIPQGVKHWHGATADSWFQHLAFHTDVQPVNSNEWLEVVSDEQYSQLQ